MKYSTLTGSFGYDGVNEFLRDLSYGKGRTTPVRGAKMPKVGAWYMVLKSITWYFNPLAGTIVQYLVL